MTDQLLPEAIRGKTPAATLDLGGRHYAFFYPTPSESQALFGEAVRVLAPFLASSAANLGRMLMPLIAGIAEDAVLLPEHDGAVDEDEGEAPSAWDDEGPGWDEDETPSWEEDAPRDDVGIDLEAGFERLMRRGRKVIAEKGLSGAVLEMSAVEQSGRDLARVFVELKPRYVRALMQHVWVRHKVGTTEAWQHVGPDFDAVFEGRHFMSHYLVALMAMGGFWAPFDVGAISAPLADLQKLSVRFRRASSATSSAQASTSKTPSTTPSSPGSAPSTTSSIASTGANTSPR